MMSEKKFKVGDRVRVDLRGQESAFVNPPQYKEGTIIDFGDYGDGDEYEILICEYEPDRDIEYASEDKLTLIEAFNPRTAFLQDLKSVLAKHKATIFGLDLWAKINDKTYDFGDTEYLSADNIMEYDKK